MARSLRDCDYATKLDQNLKDLYARLKSGRYQAPVIRRVYIPKANGKLRPLGITTIEDRVVQKAVSVGNQRGLRARLSGLFVRIPPEPQCARRSTSAP